MRRFQRGMFVGLAGTATACTLASGWSDLQGGAGATVDGGSDTQKQEDVRALDVTNVDGEDIDTGTVTGPSEKCNGATCSANQTCCHDPGFFTACKTLAECKAADGWIFNCQSTGGCKSGICCIDYSDFVSTCQESCQPGSQQLCDPVKTDCVGGKTCTEKIGATSFMGCK